MRNFIVLLFVLGFVMSCSSEDDVVSNDSNNQTNKSDEKEILSFTFLIEGEEYSAQLRNDSIVYKFKSDIDITDLTPQIEVSDKATVFPPSGSAINFNSTLIFEVTAEDGSIKEYSAVITKEGSDTKIYSFYFDNLAPGQASYDLIDMVQEDQDTIVYSVPYASPLSNLEAFVIIDENSKVKPESGLTLDFTKPIVYEVTAEDGSNQDYLIMVERYLDKLQLSNNVSNAFKNADTGSLVTFEVNALNPYSDSLKVALKNEQRTYSLLVNSIDIDKKEVTVQMPNDYLNDRYQLEMYIEHDNFDSTESFTLDKGTVNFLSVRANGQDAIEELFIPEGSFYVDMYINESRATEYSYYLKKDGKEYAVANTLVNEDFNYLGFQLPDMSVDNGIEGTGHEFVIEIDGVKTFYNFVNNEGNTINIVRAKRPVITGIAESNIYSNSSTITLQGENLYYPGLPRNSASFILRQASGSDFYSVTLSSSNYVNGEIKIDFGGRAKKPGTYYISYQSNIENFGRIDTNIPVVIELPPSEHPTLEVDGASLYYDMRDTFPGQIRLNFNENIESYTISKVVIPGANQEITSYFTYPTSILTGRVSNFSDVRFNPFGYVIVVDNNVEYKVYFYLNLVR
ncbi:hypothetical protein J8281_01465 [Aquimarina sp. U1-2]|uniref:hypothetical protein n=1 Tax=Aquimarina sp. U1-2 TaxID=2823141 RepID=UPI001AEC7FAE|nr:hypothetical protein [Aquimarina sp. U1-2]MBP2830840.1 hypothetical protein [Aquimarina sp. U1-2]